MTTALRSKTVGVFYEILLINWLKYFNQCALVTPSMPAAASSFNCPKHSHNSSLFIRWNRLVNLNFGSLWAFSAMRCSFVNTLTSFLCTIYVSLQHGYYCDRLSSCSITCLQQYYAIIRLPAQLLHSSFYYHLSGILSFHERPGRVSRVDIYSSLVNMPCSRTPGTQSITCYTFAIFCFDFRRVNNVVHPNSTFEAQSLQLLRLRPIALFPPCLTFGFSPSSPMFTYRWLACLAGTGFPPA